MPSYVITGASRGLGLSAKPENTVVGLVRDKAASEKNAAGFKRPNLHFVQADLGSFDAIKNSVEEVSKLTSGSLDYLIANAAYVSPWSPFSPLGELGETPDLLEEDLLQGFKVNVVANIHLFNLYLPLIRKGSAKKIITISTGMADLDLINEYTVEAAGPYSISKAAMNVAVAKFNAQYGKEGILFLSISPGVVDTSLTTDKLSPENQEKQMKMAQRFMQYAPHWKGPVTPEVSVKDVLSVIDKASVEGGYGGGFISHLGNKQWL